jgi:hypothetical protein
MKMKLGAKKQPKMPTVTHKVPRKSKVLRLNLTLKTPNNNPKMTLATLEMVTNWLAVAMETGSEKPKNAIVTSSKNNPVRNSIKCVEKNAKVSDGTNRLPEETFSIEFCFNLSLPAESLLYLQEFMFVVTFSCRCDK